jgi:glycerophosphoryl diester phosphodiesterase
VEKSRKGLTKKMTTTIAAIGIAGGLAGGLSGGIAEGIAGAAPGFDLQGHRGARGLMPENSLPGFAKALSIGVSTLELDVGVTKDGHVVVIHNPRMEPEIARTANGSWLTESGPAINSLTLDEVKSFDIGRLNPNSRYGGRYPDQMAIDGTRVPTLGEVFDLIIKSGNTDVRFNIETKLNPDKPELSLPPKEFARVVLDVVNTYKMENRVAIQSFDWRTLQEIQHLAPDMTTSYLTVNQSWLNNLQRDQPGASPWMSGFDVDNFDGSAPRAIQAAGGKIWSSYHQEVDAASIQVAHELGLLVKVWTVNDKDRMIELIDIGVDGIITDYPDVLRDVLSDRKITVPPPTPVTP